VGVASLPLLSNEQLPLVWPIFGTGIAALTCAGLHVWPAVLISNLAVHAILALWMGRDQVASLPEFFMSAAAISALSVAIAAIARAASQGESPVHSTRGLTALLLGGTLVILPISLIVLSELQSSWPEVGDNPLFAAAVMLEIGLLSLLVPGYAVIAWWHSEARARRVDSAPEFVALAACFCAIAGLSFLGWNGSWSASADHPSASTALALCSLPAFLWAAIRFGPAGCSLGMLISVGFSAFSPNPGIRGAFDVFSDPRSGPVHLVFGFASIAGVYVAAISQRLRRTADQLLAASAALENTVVERTSELARANSELASEIERRRRAHQIARLGHWSWNRDRNEMFSSEELCDLLGLGSGPQAVSAIQFGEAFGVGEQRQRLSSEIAAVLGERRSFTVEFEIHHASRGRIAIESRGDPEFDASGALIRASPVRRKTSPRAANSRSG
jgi:PAS domain-containing protein